MPAGKGGRAAKGGRGKGSSQSRKAVKTVKADDLEFLSSDEDDEPNTMKVLRSLLVERGSSGTVADLVKRGRPKSEQTVNVGPLFLAQTLKPKPIPPNREKG